MASKVSGGGSLSAAAFGCLGQPSPRSSSERLCPALPGQIASGRHCLCPDRSRNYPSNPFPLTLKGTSQNSGRLFAGLTHSLLPQQWVSKGTSPFGRTPAFPVRTFPSCYSGKRRHLSPRKQRAALSGFTRANSEWAILPLPGQGHKPSLHPFPLALKGTSQNSGRLFAGLTHSLLPQQWVSKGTSPFGRTPRIPGTNLRQLTLRKEALSQREFF